MESTLDRILSLKTTLLLGDYLTKAVNASPLRPGRKNDFNTEDKFETLS